MALTDLAIKSAKPRDTEYKLSDQFGLYLLIKPNGKKVWNQAYRFSGKQKKLTHGTYPVVGLAEARDERDWARKILKEGKDPSVVRRLEKAAAVEASANTFEAIGEEWLARIKEDGHLGAKALDRHEYLLDVASTTRQDDGGAFGKRPISEISAAEVLAVLRKVEKTNRLETASRLRTTCAEVFRFGIQTGRCENDPTVPLKGALRRPKVKHRAALLDENDIGPLMRGLRAYHGHYAVRAGLLLEAYTFVRTDEMRWAAKTEFNLDALLWSIPGERMKMDLPHLVPLSRQAAEIVRELIDLAPGKLLLPSPVNRGRPIGENSMLQALRRLGYAKEEMTGHGFRRMASTRLNEMGWNPEWIERQLAHKDKNTVRRAYNAAEYLPGRIEMMQAWADYLDRLAAQLPVEHMMDTDDEDLIG